MQIEVRDMIPEDWPDVREIYRQGIDSGDATFEREIPGWEDWNARRHLTCRLVAESDGAVVGFACVSPASRRAVYSGVCEIMVYVLDETAANVSGACSWRPSSAPQRRRACGCSRRAFFPRTLRRFAHTSASASES